LEAYQEQQNFHIVETPQFKTIGIMLDCSRNAVMKPTTVNKLLRYMALMGLNMLLYTEDTYTLEGEIKGMDDYAYQFGIEIIPCIQTLGHLSMVLKWPEFRELQENERVLLVGEEETYTFIEKMIRAATAPLRSKRIHLGMDSNNQPSLENDVLSTDEVRGTIPQGVSFVYWDYFTRDQQFYLDTIRKHKQLGSNPIFAGGVVACSTFAANTARTFESANPALIACKNEGIEEVFVTIWGDDAAEYNPFTALLGFQFYAEHGYSTELDMDKLKRRFEFCTGIDFEVIMDLNLLDNIEGINKDNRWPPNVSKYVFWQDPLLGL
jgi:hexosaminidase